MTNPIVDRYGNKRWFNSQGEIHRDDGPAEMDPHGYKAWYQNGQFHREDGPAAEMADGRKFWFIKGQRIT